MTWIIAGFAWTWFWGFILALAAVQQQKGRMRLGGWDWIICALWPISTPLAIFLLICESYLNSKGGK